MKVKARVNMYTDERDLYGNRYIKLDISVFSIPKNVKIDINKLKEIEFNIPVINELEKYSSKELEEELNSRNKNRVACKHCDPKLRNFSAIFAASKSFCCPLCGQINHI